MPGRSASVPRRGSKSSASSFVVSKAGEKGNFFIATAVPIVIPRITQQVAINTGWMSKSLVIRNQGWSGITLTP